jgi:hypothetical protein
MLNNLFRVYFSPDDAGGAGQNDSQNKQNTGANEANGGNNNADEVVSLKKSELEGRYNNKFAEGAKKAEKSFLDEFGVKSKDELKAKINGNSKPAESSEELIKVKSELTEMKALNACKDLDVKKEFQPDVIALLKGKGKELTEENITEEVKKHPEWIKSQEQPGARDFGGAAGKKNPNVDEKEQARKLMGL